MDIITFYNEIFIPAVKPLLVEIGPVRNDQAVEANNKPEGKLRNARFLLDVRLISFIHECSP